MEIEVANAEVKLQDKHQTLAFLRKHIGEEVKVSDSRLFEAR